MATIQSLKAREILDSRGNPTLEVSCTLTSRKTGIFSVPSGASTGVHEALELRDGDGKRFGGLGVLDAVQSVSGEMHAFFSGKEWGQKTLDEELIRLDGTPNKSRLGANAILGVSVSFAKALAQEQGIQLYEYFGSLCGQSTYQIPQPMFNVINGGKHADSGLDFQEFMIGPVAFDTVHEKIRVGAEIVSTLRGLLKKGGYSVGLGDEGGVAPKLAGGNEEALSIIEEAIIKSGYTFDQIKIGIDVAASSFYQNGSYTLTVDGEKRTMTSSDLIDYYKKLVSSHPIISIEDGLAEDDFDGFAQMKKEVGDSVVIVGDDLTVTNSKRIDMAIEKQSISSVLIKLNQIGTLSETVEAIAKTKRAGWIPFVSHRSGETVDTTIADLAVGLSCRYIKSGSLARGERVCKYNRLMEIEDELSAS